MSYAHDIAKAYIDLTEAHPEKAGAIAKDLKDFIVNHKLEGLTDAIMSHVEHAEAELKRKNIARLTTPSSVSDGTAKEIAKSLTDNETEVHTDDSLIGGFIFEEHFIETDASIKNLLKK